MAKSKLVKPTRDKPIVLAKEPAAKPRAAKKRAPETSLYAAIKTHLESLGYEAKGEVCGCDIVACGHGEKPFVVVTELKMAFSLELVLQGVERFSYADEVWLAVEGTRRGRDRDSRAHKLCRLLGFGLLAVHPFRGLVEVLAEPAPWKPRPNLKKRARLVKEHRARRGDPTKGGSARAPIMTAYRQQALACAQALREGPQTTRALKPFAPLAPSILLSNVYGWFERVARGSYKLTGAGEAALSAFAGFDASHAAPSQRTLLQQTPPPPT